MYSAGEGNSEMLFASHLLMQDAVHRRMLFCKENWSICKTFQRKRMRICA